MPETCPKCGAEVNKHLPYGACSWCGYPIALEKMKSQVLGLNSAIMGWKAMADESAKLLEQCKPYVEQCLPPEPDHHCGGPNSACDGNCVDYIRTMKLINDVTIAVSNNEANQE